MIRDDLFARGERARRDGRALVQQLAVLRELRMLDRDFRIVTQKLARTMTLLAVPGTREGVDHLLEEAEEMLASAHPPPTILFH